MILSSYHDIESDETEMRIYLADAAEAPEAARRLADALRVVGCAARVETAEVPDEDWKLSYRRHFKTEKIARRLVTVPTWEFDDFKASSDPDMRARIPLVLDPGLAFGTGKHETTKACLEYIDELATAQPPGSQATQPRNSLLDMGCGTAILAILAALRGASPITGIDIDEWAYNNAIENIQLNHTEQITLKKGGAELLGDEKFDIILANINKNILLNDIKKYVKVLNSNGLLILSGFYESDIDAIEKECNQYGLEKLSYEKNNNWVAVRFIKK